MTYIVLLLAAAARLIPHLPNFAPIGAMAFFGGRSMLGRKAFVFPLVALFISDIFLGFYAWQIMAAVYVSFVLYGVVGRMMRNHAGALPVLGGTLIGSLLFFFITNWAVWAFSPLYPKTIMGLGVAYLAGVPFLRNTILGDAVYVSILCGGYALIVRLLAAMRTRGMPIPVAQKEG